MRRSDDAFRLYAISPQGESNGEARIARSLLEQGLARYHVRKIRPRLGAVRGLLEEFSEGFRARLVLHSHFRLARRYGCSIHLPERLRRRYARFRRSGEPRSATSVTSTSFHGADELRERPADFEYAFLSPVFPTITKIVPAVLTPAEISRALDRANTPLIGLGGVCAENVRVLKEMRFAGAALHGVLWSSNDPLARFREVAEAL